MKLMCVYIYIFKYIYYIYILYIYWHQLMLLLGYLGQLKNTQCTSCSGARLMVWRLHLDKAKLQACLQNIMEMSKLGSLNTKTMDHWTNRLWGALIRDSPNMTSWFQINYIEPLDISLFKRFSGYSSCVRIIAPNDFSASRSHQESSNFTLSIPAIRCLWLPVKSCQCQFAGHVDIYRICCQRFLSADSQIYFDCYYITLIVTCCENCILLSRDVQSLLLLQSLLVKSLTFIVNEYHRCLIRLCSWCALSNICSDEGLSDKNMLTHHKTLQILQGNHDLKSSKNI